MIDRTTVEAVIEEVTANPNVNEKDIHKECVKLLDRRLSREIYCSIFFGVEDKNER